MVGIRVGLADPPPRPVRQLCRRSKGVKFYIKLHSGCIDDINTQQQTQHYNTLILPHNTTTLALLHYTTTDHTRVHYTRLHYTILHQTTPDYTTLDYTRPDYAKARPSTLLPSVSPVYRRRNMQTTHALQLDNTHRKHNKRRKQQDKHLQA